MTRHARPGRVASARSFGRRPDGFRRDALWNVQEQRAYDCGDQTEQRQSIKSARITAGQIFHQAHIGRSEEASEIVDALEDDDLRLGATRKCPEWKLGHVF